MTLWADFPEAQHLSQIERRCAAHFLKVNPATVKGPLSGVLLGECPGKNTRSYLPLFPYPPNSAGGRLMKYSGIPAGPYLGRLLRRNFFEEHQEVWPHVAFCHKRALALHEEFMAGVPKRIVLLGTRVSRAFGFDGFWQLSEKDGVCYATVPHPSGLNLTYNDRANILALRRALQWASDAMCEFLDEL